MDTQLKKLLATYKPSAQTVSLIRSTPILFLVGPTGAGKDALKSVLLTSGRYHHIVSHTTRSPRINHGIIEQDGVDYHFIDLAQARRMLEAHEFIEAKIYSGNVYGTSVSEIQQAHNEAKTAITDLEVQGIAVYKAIDPNVMAVFLLPPDFETWQARLQRRYGDVVDAADAKLRMQTALVEIEQLLNHDYYVAVVNRELSETLAEIKTIASTGTYDSARRIEARRVAQGLAKDIEKYLETPAQTSIRV